MRINNNNIWQWYVDFFLGNSSRLRQLPKIKTNNNNCDTFQLSWRAKRDILNAHIEETINSGEPLKGVTFEQFCDYYYDKHGHRRREDEMMQEYKQALKGDNASLREKEWRTNPDYRIPPRLYDSPEIIADREAALEKYRNGEELELWEKYVMHAFSDMGSGSKIIAEASFIRGTKSLQESISSALSSAGIELDEDTELTFKVWGRSIEVCGDLDDDTLKAIQDALYGIGSGRIGYSLQTFFYRSDRNRASSYGSIPLDFLKKAEELLQDEGGGTTIFDLSLDKDGNIVGLPESMDKFIRENAIGKFGDTLDMKYIDREKDILEARYMKEAFLTAIKVIQSGSYERYKATTCNITYKNGVLSS